VRLRTERFFPWLYDLVMAPIERIHLGRWRENLAGGASGLVLEIASGTGLNFPHYPAEAKVIATEFDPEMLERARSRVRDSSAHVALVAADARTLPFRDGLFDTAVVGLAMCTIPDPSAALMELRRVLRQDGVLRMLEHVRSSNALIGRMQDSARPVWSRLAGGCRLNERTVERVEAAGFALSTLASHLADSVVEIAAFKR
jgi:ubiquinone/menaquinone biosynthesis C-methylase UbiE